MAKVFISYRRADSAPFAGRIYDRLVLKFSKQNVFKDVDDIPVGVQFGRYIEDSLRQCAVALVIIGRDWFGPRDGSGRRRLDDPADWVRIEVERALALDLVVIPIVLEESPMPEIGDLPESIAPLAQINGLRIRNDPDFSRDMDRLVAAVERAFAARSRRSGLSTLFSRPRPGAPSPASVQPESVAKAPPEAPAAQAALVEPFGAPHPVAQEPPCVASLLPCAIY